MRSASSKWDKVVLLGTLLLRRVNGICYYPDGTATPDDTPCLGGSEPSWCCGFGYACLSNRICMATPETPNATTYVRGSCTDQTWRSANCPSFCVNADSPYKDDTGGGEGMALCPNTTNTFYCIDFDQSAVNCASLINIAVQATGTPAILTTIGYGSSTTPSMTPTSISTTSTTSSSSTTTSGSAMTTNHYSSAAMSSTTSTQSPSALPPSSTPTPNPSVDAGTIAGATVGGVAGLCIMVAVAIFYFRRSRKRSRHSPWLNNAAAGHAETAAPSYTDDNPQFRQYSDQRGKYEAFSPPSELDGTGRVELSGDPARP